MRHLIVTRVTFALVALFLLCAGLFAWLRAGATGTASPAAGVPEAGVSEAGVSEAGVPEGGVPEGGAVLFERHCASCHTADALRPRLGAGPDRATRLREVEIFLQDHGEAAPDADRSILDYLAGTGQR